jgi:hypothetical protein
MSDLSLGHHGAYVMVPLRLIEGRWMAMTNAGRDSVLTGVRRCADMNCGDHPRLPTVQELMELLCVGDGACSTELVPVTQPSPSDGVNR